VNDLLARAERVFFELCDLDAEARRRRLQELESVDPELARKVAHMLRGDRSADPRSDPERFAMLGPEAASYVESALDRIASREPGRTPSLTSGKRMGGYVIDALLACGGMGEVYRAHQPSLGGRTVAIKVLPPRGRDDAGTDRFEREALLLAAIHHPHLVEVYDYGEQHGTPFIAMRFVSGLTLQELLATWNESLRTAADREHVVRWIAEVATGVDRLHRSGLVHCDIKPSNVVIEGALETEDDLAAGHAVLIDFGLVSEVSARPHSRKGESFVTPRYASPEQRDGEPLDERSDVYSLGATLASVLEVFGAPSGRYRLLERTRDRAMDPRPAHRHPGAAELARDLRRWLEGEHRSRRAVGRRGLTGIGLALAGLPLLWLASSIVRSRVASGATRLPVAPLASAKRLCTAPELGGATVAKGPSFGRAAAAIGDLDGDGVEELCVGVPRAAGDAGAVWILFRDRDGNVVRQYEIGPGSRAPAPVFQPGYGFGSGITSVGDLDGDGLPELAVGAGGGDDGGSGCGALWILFLRPDGSVRSSSKISAASGGFSGALEPGDQFGTALARLGDLDGDGTQEVAASVAGNDDRGALWILSLDAGGNVRSGRRIDVDSGGPPGLFPQSGDELGYSIAALGDLDGNGVADLAAGAPFDDQAGIDAGALWILFLNADGSLLRWTRVTPSELGSMPPLGRGYRFGEAVAAPFPSDGTVGEVLVGATGDDLDGPRCGVVWQIRLTARGTVARAARIGLRSGPLLGRLDPLDGFGQSIAFLRDAGGMGRPGLLIGAIGDDEGGLNAGACWILRRQ